MDILEPISHLKDIPPNLYAYMLAQTVILLCCYGLAAKYGRRLGCLCSPVLIAIMSVILLNVLTFLSLVVHSFVKSWWATSLIYASNLSVVVCMVWVFWGACNGGRTRGASR